MTSAPLAAAPSSSAIPSPPAPVQVVPVPLQDTLVPMHTPWNPAHPWAPALLPAPSQHRGIMHLAERVGDLVSDPKVAARLAARLQQHADGWQWIETCLPKDPSAQLKQTFSEHLQATDQPFVALLLTCMQHNAPAWLSRRRRGQIMRGLALLTRVECATYATALFERPELARSLRQAYAVQERIELYHRGDSLATFLPFVRPLERAPAALPDNAAARAQVAATPLQVADQPHGLENGWEAHGRTLHFVDPSGQPMGLKVQKGSDDALRREDIMDRCFAAWKEPLQLQSELPRSRGILYFRPDDAMRAAIADQGTYLGETQFTISADELVTALLYEAPHNYHLHLHEVTTLEGLREASHRALHDAAVVASELGLVHTAPADLYHNKEKNRRYYWNVDHVHRAVGKRLGTGRLDRWERSINHNNLGEHGCRDLKHFQFYQDLAGDYRNNERLALTSGMGDMLFAWSLSVAKWFKDHDELVDTISLADTLRDGFVTYFAAYTRRSVEACKAFLDASVNWDLIGEQMLYFMSEDYVPDVTAGRVRQGMCGPHAAVHASIPAEGWEPGHGWMLDAVHRDLGPKNGPFPVTELVAALYISTAFAVQMRQ